MDATLQTVKEKIVVGNFVEEANFHQCNATTQQYSLPINPDDDPININRPKSERPREVEGSSIPSDQFLQPLRIKKVHIQLPKNPKLDNIRDYWNGEAVAKITDLLHEYQDLVPTNVSEMRGIVADLGDLKIPLQLAAKPSQQQKKAWKDQHIKVNPSKEEDLYYFMTTDWLSNWAS